MNSKKHIVFLFTELSGYFLACLKQLEKEAVVHVFHWPINPEAPFKLDPIESVHFYDRKKYDLNSLQNTVAQINPDIIICTGWIDSDYVKVTKTFKSKIPTVLTLDNHWHGNMKQWLLASVSWFYIQTRFSHVWIPGSPQEKYAERLGFKSDRILKGYYSADTNYFSSLYQESSAQNRFSKKTFLYIGRYIESKGIKHLWKAFTDLKKEQPNNWKLICAGTGALFEERVKHPDIEHVGFLQPDQLQSIIDRSTAFILPSLYEPWGVVVHEMACAGMPMICSNQVGASSLFVNPGKSGFVYQMGDLEALKTHMKSMISMDLNTYKAFCEESRSLSKLISPQQWAQTLLSISL